MYLEKFLAATLIVIWLIQLTFFYKEIFCAKLETKRLNPADKFRIGHAVGFCVNASDNEPKRG